MAPFACGAMPNGGYGYDTKGEVEHGLLVPRMDWSHSAPNAAQAVKALSKRTECMSKYLQVLIADIKYPIPTSCSIVWMDTKTGI